MKILSILAVLDEDIKETKWNVKIGPTLLTPAHTLQRNFSELVLLSRFEFTLDQLFWKKHREKSDRLNGKDQISN